MKHQEEKESAVIPKVKTEEVNSTPSHQELEFQERNSVAVVGGDSEYDDQDYYYQELDYGTSDNSHGLYYSALEDGSHFY